MALFTTLVLAASLSGSWSGSYTLGGPAPLTFTIQGQRASVALGAGHAGLQSVPVSIAGRRFSFRLPGAPGPLAFSGRLAGSRVRGTVRQGGARGAFQAKRGASPGLVAPGLYSGGGHELAVVDDPYGPARLLDLDTGSLHALYPSGSRFVVGSGWATRDPTQGTARFTPSGAEIGGATLARASVRQLEVRFRSGAATLSGTLRLPPGPGPHAAVAWVHGSGRTTRAYLPDLQALLLRHGVGVLSYDKRGIGQSGGSYPGESPYPSTIDTLARDAEAAVRFLATRPEVDHHRIGLAGHSQAGWIVPFAASREAAVRFALIFSGPAVTADENDHYQNLTGEGETPPKLSEHEIDARVLAEGPGGVDPIPWIASLHIPVLWVYGGLDQHIPPRLSALRLAPLAAEAGRDFAIETFPHANHALVETQTGLTSEMLRSDTFAPGLFADVGEWIAHTIRPLWRARSASRPH
jgi:uncharacterized protein